MGVGTGNLQPAAGRPGDLADFAGDFGEILILAEDDSDVELPGSGHADHVEAEPEIDAFFARDKEFLRATVRMRDKFAAVSQRA